MVLNGWKNQVYLDLMRHLLKNYNENSDKGYFFEVDIDYLKELFNLQKYLPFLPERKKVNKCEKLICSIENKKSYTYNNFKTSTKSRFKI